MISHVNSCKHAFKWEQLPYKAQAEVQDSCLAPIQPQSMPIDHYPESLGLHMQQPRRQFMQPPADFSYVPSSDCNTAGPL
jgi:hypothetical protein